MPARALCRVPERGALRDRLPRRGAGRGDRAPPVRGPRPGRAGSQLDDQPRAGSQGQGPRLSTLIRPCEAAWVEAIAHRGWLRPGLELPPGRAVKRTRLSLILLALR